MKKKIIRNKIKKIDILEGLNRKKQGWKIKFLFIRDSMKKIIC